MAKDISVKIIFDSNGKAVMGQMTISAKEQSAVKSAQKDIKSSMKDIVSFSGAAVNAIRGAIEGISSIAQPYIAFDQAMRAANTMAGKGAKDYELLKDKVKALSKEVPVARDALANGLYKVISNGVPEDNWMSFLEQSTRSSIGGIADLGEVVKVTSTVIKNYGLSWEDAGQHI